MECVRLQFRNRINVSQLSSISSTKPAKTRKSTQAKSNLPIVAELIVQICRYDDRIRIITKPHEISVSLIFGRCRRAQRLG